MYTSQNIAKVYVSCYDCFCANMSEHQKTMQKKVSKMTDSVIVSTASGTNTISGTTVSTASDVYKNSKTIISEDFNAKVFTVKDAREVLNFNAFCQHTSANVVDSTTELNTLQQIFTTMTMRGYQAAWTKFNHLGAKTFVKALMLIPTFVPELMMKSLIYTKNARTILFLNKEFMETVNGTGFVLEDVQYSRKAPEHALAELYVIYLMTELHHTTIYRRTIPDKTLRMFPEIDVFKTLDFSNEIKKFTEPKNTTCKINTGVNLSSASGISENFRKNLDTEDYNDKLFSQSYFSYENFYKEEKFVTETCGHKRTSPQHDFFKNFITSFEVDSPLVQQFSEETGFYPYIVSFVEEYLRYIGHERNKFIAPETIVAVQKHKEMLSWMSDVVPEKFVEMTSYPTKTGIDKESRILQEPVISFDKTPYSEFMHNISQFSVDNEKFDNTRRYFSLGNIAGLCEAIGFCQWDSQRSILIAATRRKSSTSTALQLALVLQPQRKKLVSNFTFFDVDAIQESSLLEEFFQSISTTPKDPRQNLRFCLFNNWNYFDKDIERKMSMFSTQDVASWATTDNTIDNTLNSITDVSITDSDAKSTTAVVVNITNEAENFHKASVLSMQNNSKNMSTNLLYSEEFRKDLRKTFRKSVTDTTIMTCHMNTAKTNDWILGTTNTFVKDLWKKEYEIETALQFSYFAQFLKFVTKKNIDTLRHDSQLENTETNSTGNSNKNSEIFAKFDDFFEDFKKIHTCENFVHDTIDRIEKEMNNTGEESYYETDDENSFEKTQQQKTLRIENKIILDFCENIKEITESYPIFTTPFLLMAFHKFLIHNNATNNLWKFVEKELSIRS